MCLDALLGFVRRYLARAGSDSIVDSSDGKRIQHKDSRKIHSVAPEFCDFLSRAVDFVSKRGNGKQSGS
jgi:hypothetical protein